MMNKSGVWLSIMEYATLRGVSISTVRRSIKSRRVISKKEKGKFFIFTETESSNKESHRESNEHGYERKPNPYKVENELLKSKLKKLEEENNDLKMLIQLYEKENKTSFKTSQTSSSNKSFSRPPSIESPAV